MGESALKLAHQPCPNPECGSSDAFSVYDDGHGFCFSCQTYQPSDDAEPVAPTPRRSGLIPIGDFQAIPNRRLPEDICRKFSYSVSEKNGKTCQVAEYRNQHGEIVGQKLRYKDKTFETTGDFSDVQLFGQHLWSAGKRLVITEGEIDCLSYAAATNGTWAVCSVPNGAQSALKAVKRNIEFINSFEEVVFLFDNDEAGRQAAKVCAEVVRPGHAKIASLPLKDANDMLVNGRVKELKVAVYDAKVVRPDGVVSGTEIFDKAMSRQVMGIPYQWEGLNNTLFGVRPKELVTIVAGTGVGKSTICSEIAYHLGVKQDMKVGYIALEEDIGRTAQRLMAIELDKPIHLPGQEVSDDEMTQAYQATAGNGNFFFYDHFGSLDSDNLLAKLEYMVIGLGVEVLILDHLSIVVSGMDLDGDERRQLDYTVTQLRSFTERTKCTLFLVSHLRRPSGDKGHEDGVDVSLAHIRGSQAISQLSDAVISVQRNMSSGDNQVLIRCLKNRYAGITGPCCNLEFDKHTGRISEIKDTEDF